MIEIVAAEPALPSSPSSPDKIMSIQYVRALASIVVIFWHTGWSYTVLGQAGVDLFFVVSGFVMMLVSGREDSPARFGLARICRIVPLYWLTTLVVAALDRPPAAKLTTSLLFWPDGPFPLVIQGWSLNLEMIYYLLFAMTLLVPVRVRLRVLALEMVVLCVLLPIVLPGSAEVATWSSPLAVEFLAGACLYSLWRDHCIPIGAAAWIMGIAATIVLAASHFLGGAPAGWVRVAFWGLPAFAIVAAGLGIERAGQLPRIALLAVLGEASYAIYLTHLLALRLVAGPLHSLWAPMALCLALVWTCVIGWIVHRSFERPMHRFTSRLLRRSWPKPQPRSV